MKVKLEEGVWIAAWGDDLGRIGTTVYKEFAREFDNEKEALKALVEARKSGPFKNAELQGDFVSGFKADQSS